jgi:hypothetical protein
MSWSFNPFTGNLDIVGSGGSVVFEGEVPTFADLPVTVGDPAIGAAYLVRDSTGVWLVNRRQAGIYIRRNDAGLATDWEYGGDYPVNSVNGQTGNVSLTAANVGAAWGQVLSQQTITGNTLLAAGRNRRITLFAVGVTANVDLPHDDNQAGDVVTLVGAFSVASTLSIRRASVMNVGNPIAYTTVATLTASGQSFTFVSDGTATGWTLRSVDTHDHAAADITSGTFNNARINFASPADIGNTTPAAGTFTDLTSSNLFTLPSATPSNPLGGQGSLRVSGTGLNTKLVYRAMGATPVDFTVVNTGDFAAPPAIGNTTRNTGAFTTLSAAPTSGSALTLTGGTVTASAPLIDATQTWNNGAVTFTGLRVNVTNTASGASSIPVDFQVGGSSQFRVRRSGGGVDIAGSSSGVRITDYAITGLGGGLQINSASGGTGFIFDSGQITTVGCSIFEQRTGTTAQTFRIYNTFTDASNYERGFMRWSSNVLQIGHEVAGTGSVRSMEITTAGNLSLRSSISTGNMEFYTSGSLRWTIGASGSMTSADGLAIRFGGTSASFPRLVNSSAVLRCQLADGSAYANFEALLRAQGTAPATAGATGTAGDIRYDADYIYVATATNTWKRAAIATW